MFLRIPMMMTVATIVLIACSSGAVVPDDQVIKPSKAPTGWTTTDLGELTIAAPAEWKKDATLASTKTTDVTTWRSDNVGPGELPSGIEVKVISTPQQPADKAAEAIAVSAMALLESGRIDPVEITWPAAESGFYLAYDAKFGAVGNESNFTVRTSVFDLVNGYQIQVTSIALQGTDSKTPDRILESVKLTPSKKGG